MPTVMFDAVDLDNVPPDAPVVAGYVNGRWPTFGALKQRFPNAGRFSIDVNGTADADCLDIERGDARPDQAPAWVRRQQASGAARPAVYCSVSVAQQVLNLLAAAGIARSAVRLWTAHYTYYSHRCGPHCGFGFADTADATQWTDRSMNRSLDQSLCADDFLAVPAPPTPAQQAVIGSFTLGGQPVQLIDCPIVLDGVGDGDYPAPVGFLAVSGPAVHDKYDQSTHDTDTIIVPVGVRRSGTPSGFMLAVKGGPPSSTVHATVLAAD